MDPANSNYDEDSLYCPECSQYWTRCECVAVAALAAEWREDSIVDNEAESLDALQERVEFHQKVARRQP